MKRWSITVLLGLGMVSALSAQEKHPSLKVLPWNGHKAAASLTFDDGCASQLDAAVPELNKRQMRATFFLIANRITRKDEWRKLLVQGHEIGNHTLDHKHASELTSNDAESQVLGAHHVLQKEFGIPMGTFAYPYSEITPELKSQVGKCYWLARGGREKWVTSDREAVDWLDVPCRKVMAKTSFTDCKKWMEKNFKTGGWVIWAFKGLAPDVPENEPVSGENFRKILDSLQAKDIWLAPFQTVGSYWRAQKIFEKSKVESKDEETWTWEVPKDLHPDVTLKMKVIPASSGTSASFEIWQGRQKINPDKTGVYPLNFNEGQLTLRPMPKS